MPREKKTHNIYLIDVNKVKSAFDLEKNASLQSIVEAIMSNDELYHKQVLKEHLDTKGFSIALFFRAELIVNNKFSSFCSSFVKEDQDAVTFIPASSSSVLFVWKNANMYAITTGQGYRMVDIFAVPKFGLIIATIFGKNMKLTSLGSNEVSSIVHSTQTVFTTEVDVQSVDSMDTIYREIGARINDPQLVHSLLNLERESKKRSMKLIAKDYIQFGSALDFQGLLHLLQELDNYDLSQETDGFNSITPLTKKRHSKLIQEINSAIIHTVYEALVNDRECPFELFHQNTESFIRADKYQVYHGNKSYADEEDYCATTLLKTAFSTFLDGTEWAEEEFAKFISSSKIRSMSGDAVSTDGSIFDHFSGEIDVSGTTYLIFDGNYYRESTAYVDKLKSCLQKKLREELKTEEITTKWSKGKNEDWFNKEVANKEGYVQLHRMIVSYIEFADLLKIADGVLTIVHVKDGFDGEMRVLDRQVEMSLRMLMDAKQNNRKTFLKKLYQKALENDSTTHIKTQFPSEQAFVDCIRKSKVRYLIVIRPSNKDLLKCRSNVAKHCLNELIDRCFRRGIEFNIQLK